MCIKTVIASSIFGLGVVLIAVGAGLGWGLFPVVVKEEIKKTVQLKEGSDAWGMWETLPQPLVFKIYFFHIRNKEEVMAGGKPIVEERGPYTFNEFRSRYDIEVEGDQITYKQNLTFNFSQELSGEGLSVDDVFTNVNPVLINTVNTVDKDFDKGFERTTIMAALNSALPDMFEELELTDSENYNVFQEMRIQDFLFDGIPIKCKTTDAKVVCEVVEAMKIPLIRESEEPGLLKDLLFSVLYHKNTQPDGTYTINSGTKNVNKLGSIEKWEGSSSLDIWTGEECNKIRGTDSTIYAPFVNKDERLYIFSTDICRTVSIAYEKEVTYRDIPGLRFTLTADNTMSVENRSDNYCYCLENSGCLKDGAMDMSNCQQVKSPVVFSFPHFYQGSTDYVDAIDGLEPQEDLHGTFLEIEPNTGVSLRGGKRIQMNNLLKPVQELKWSENFTNILLPLIWIEEGIELEKKFTDELQHELINNLNLLEGLRWGILGAGIVGVLVGAVLFFLWCC